MPEHRATWLARNADVETLCADEESPLLPPSGNQTDSELDISDLDNTQRKSTQLLASISLMLGAGIAQLGVSLVLTMHPTIASEFNCLSESNWLITTYALAMAALQPLVGKLSDVFTRKSVLLCSYLFIALGCVQCATAKTFGQMLIGRTVSGIGGAGVSTLVAVITTDLVPIREVGPWRGYLNLVGTASRSLGGPVGGYVTDTVGWRWAFIGQVPILVFATAAAIVFLPTTSRKSSTDKYAEDPELSRGLSLRDKLQRIDFLGASLIMLAVISLMLPLAAGSKLPGGLVLFCGLPSLSILLLVAFVLVEHRYAADPIVHPTVMRNKDAMMSFGALAFQAAAHIGMMYSVPIHFQVTQRASATAAGLQLMPAVVGSAFGGLATGHYSKRTGRYKWPILAGISLSAFSNILLLFFWRGNLHPVKSLFTFPGGFGAGTVGSATYTAVTAVLEPEYYAIATACQYLAQSVGQVGGLAATGMISRSVLSRWLRKGLQGRDDSETIIDRVLSNTSNIAKLKGKMKIIVLEGYAVSLIACHGLSVTLNLVAFAFAVALAERRLSKE